MLGRFEESNQYFEEAYRYADDLQKNYVNEGVAILTNPNMVPYKGEGFEILFIHYYKALNYLRLNQREEALVECKRMNIELQQLQSKFKSENKYKEDAFIHLLMGLIYDVNGDYNNAFIAYRNSYDIYKGFYAKQFGVTAPDQLKKDLLRTAWLTGFIEEMHFYEKEFGMVYKPDHEKDAELIFIWQNGLSPVKSEWSINFSVYRGGGGNVFFTNNELGLSYNYYMNDDEYKSSGLADLQFIRIAFPRYLDRKPVFSQAFVKAGNIKIQLEKTEDVGQIAFRSLKDRMLLELGKGLLRFALKKGAEIKLRQENKDLGAALGIINAITEKADTRYWSTLPNSIYYARVPLKEGNQEIKFVTGAGNNSSREISFQYDIRPGSTVFETFSSLESGPPQSY